MNVQPGVLAVFRVQPNFLRMVMVEQEGAHETDRGLPRWRNLVPKHCGPQWRVQALQPIIDDSEGSSGRLVMGCVMALDAELRAVRPDEYGLNLLAERGFCEPAVGEHVRRFAAYYRPPHGGYSSRPAAKSSAALRTTACTFSQAHRSVACDGAGLRFGTGFLGFFGSAGMHLDQDGRRRRLSGSMTDSGPESSSGGLA